MKFEYQGDPGRYYPDLGVTGAPGVAAEFDEAPDFRWVAVKPPSKKAAAPSEPAKEG